MSALSRCVALIATAAMIFAGLATPADAAIGPDSYEVTGSWGDLNSGATEWSGATYNADRHVLLTVDDETNAYEFQLNADGSIDQSQPVRVIDLDPLGDSDWEGVAWVDGDQYAFISEATGRADIYDVSQNRNSVTTRDHVWSFNAGGPQGNSGTEGIAVGSDGAFYVTDEWPSAVSRFSPNGRFEGTILIDDLIGDATGVVAAADDTLVVVSHESRVAVQLEVDWFNASYTVIGTIELPHFEQLEGVALIGDDILHFFGEDKGGQTYSQYSAEVVDADSGNTTPIFSPSDVDCSGISDIADALLITRNAVGLDPLDPSCGTGDFNQDGVTDLADALAIVQCAVGQDNGFCSNM